VSVLGRVAPSSDALLRARRFLVDVQHTNGGWGDGDTEPLSTALAILSLCVDGVESDFVALSRGSAYLFRTQQLGDMTPPEARTQGVSVVRTSVPGLIPLYFGSDRIRLGCRRLWGRESPGRLCTLLPLFMN
jgi:hypothetical protein